MPFIVYAEAKQIKLDYKSNFEYQNVWFDKEKIGLDHKKLDFKCYQIYSRPR